MTRCLLAALSCVAACGGESPRPVPVPPARPRAPASTTTDLPSFAKLDLDVDRTYPALAKIRRGGPLYLAHDSAAAFAGKSQPLLLIKTVLDGDRDGSPRRPRLLCNEDGYRVAVFMDADDLATVALHGAATAPDAGSSGDVAVDAAGAHFAAGTELEVLARSDRRATVTYHGMFVEAWGSVASDHVDVVYTPDREPEPAALDGELVRDVSVSYQPDGRESHLFARIAKNPKFKNLLLVRRLGKVANGFALVRYDEDDAYVIGWVPADAVREYKNEDGGGTGWGTIGTLGRGKDSQVTLARGTLLADPADGAIVGVVTADSALACDTECDGREPIVIVHACAGTFSLRARRL